MDEVERDNLEREGNLQDLYAEGLLNREELEAELARVRSGEPEAADDDGPGLLARFWPLPRSA